MSKPIEARLPCGCCFIVPPELLKELSRGQKVAPVNVKMFQDSFLETMRLRQVREGHRLAAFIGRLSIAPEAAPHQAEHHIFDCRTRMSLPGTPLANPSPVGESFQNALKPPGPL